MKTFFCSFRSSLSIYVLVSLTVFSCSQSTQKEVKPNVLFIVVDDLRPELKCYGRSRVVSKNIDKIANEGILFKRAYCNAPVCGASRASFLTGTRPTRTRFLKFFSRAEIEMDSVPTLPELFRSNGYYTLSNGKVFDDVGDGPGSWDEEWWPIRKTKGDYADPVNIKNSLPWKKGPAFEAINIHDTVYRDGKIANKAVQDLRRLKSIDKPFFMALGFFKPHLPFNAPKKYWDLYEAGEIELPENDYPPINAPSRATHNSGELRGYQNIPNAGKLSDDLARKLIHGYHASVSYTDAQIGKVLTELENLGLKENTVIIIIGDHGWNLREHGLWVKHCNFNTSLNAPLIISGPGIPNGLETSGIAEFIDIYPTLAELCGLELPNHLEGISLKPLIHEPERKWKDYAVSKYLKGITLVTKNYFYTEWLDSSMNVTHQMLYNHETDPDENYNIAGEVSDSLLLSLHGELRSKWGKDFLKVGRITKRRNTGPGESEYY